MFLSYFINDLFSSPGIIWFWSFECVLWYKFECKKNLRKPFSNTRCKQAKSSQKNINTGNDLPTNNELSLSLHHIINIFAIQMHRFW